MIFEIVFGTLGLIVMAFLVYMGCHISEEKRQGKSLPLFWEKKDE